MEVSLPIATVGSPRSSGGGSMVKKLFQEAGLAALGTLATAAIPFFTAASARGQQAQEFVGTTAQLSVAASPVSPFSPAVVVTALGVTALVGAGVASLFLRKRRRS